MEKEKYARIFRITPSKKQKNSYSVFRRRFSGGFEEIAVVSIVPNKAYQIDAKKYIKSDELDYLSNYFKKLANITDITISEVY